ncbi:Band 4.1-like protein 3 [Cricetulus griseus]|uniref:Band 4.1-like protein 3 n=1 Tax=Cricetulus griseus TaxID=10029 RepID=G3HT50_CRIGR|nr:Band 4.1-like protein 3 [Cricetulus griseus]
MTTESGSDSESKPDQEAEPQEAAGPQGQPGAQPGPEPASGSSEDPPALEQFPAAAAHSTPVKREVSDKDRDFAAAAAKQLEYQQFEDDKLSQKSSSSKLSRSPLKIVKRPKSMQCKVTLLDGSDYGCDVDKRSRGQVLFDKVCEHLNLLEKDYFGLTYRDAENQKNWLDPAKEIKKQIRMCPNASFLFVPSAPGRYYLCLQLRDDIVSGRLPCSFVTLALLGSYTVQSELGDYDPDECGSDYISEFRFAPNHTKELEEKVVELHKSHRLLLPEAPPKKFLTLGSKFRYSGRTQAQTRRASALIDRPAPYFERSSSKRYTMSRSLDGASVNETHEMYMKDSMSAAEVGTGQYATTKGISQTNLITSVTPEKKAEEEHGEEEDRRRKAEEATPVTALRHEGKSPGHGAADSCPLSPPSAHLDPASPTELRRRCKENESPLAASVLPNAEPASASDGQGKACLGDQDVAFSYRQQTGKGTTLFSFSLQLPESFPSLLDEDGYLSFPNLSETNLLPQSWQQFLPIRSPSLLPCFLFIFFFLLSASFSVPYALTLSFPLALCLCYLEPKAASLSASLDNDPSDSSEEEELDKTQDELMKHQTNISELKRTFLETSTETALTNEWEKRLSTSPVRLAARQEEAPMIEPLVPEEKLETKTESIETEVELTPHSQPLSTEKVLQETVLAEERRIESVQGSGDACHTAGDAVDTAETTPSDLHSAKGKEGCSVTEAAKEERGEEADKSVPEQEQPATVSHEEEQVAATHPSEALEQKSHFESSTVKMETVSVGSVSPGGVKLEISTKEVPVVHTETKTITYESSQVDPGADLEPGVLMSAQTITSETTSTTTTTHITKTVKGGISETRIEKRIVITGDADIDHDQALAQAIKEAKEQHPDMSVTKVVVHKETEITPEDGED